MKQFFWMSILSLAITLSFPILAQAEISISHELTGTMVEGSNIRLDYALEVVNMDSLPVYGLKIEQASHPQASGNTPILVGDLSALQYSGEISFSIFIPAAILPDNIGELQIDWFFEYLDINGVVVEGPVMSTAKMEGI